MRKRSDAPHPCSALGMIFMPALTIITTRQKPLEQEGLLANERDKKMLGASAAGIFAFGEEYCLPPPL
ncbi:MAG: hypothetical protein FWH17_08700 [Oscillospiraceae bacterium]|nr:hypothetical protein [Oscillospiraceae bacterium]